MTTGRGHRLGGPAQRAIAVGCSFIRNGEDLGNNNVRAALAKNAEAYSPTSTPQTNDNNNNNIKIIGMTDRMKLVLLLLTCLE